MRYIKFHPYFYFFINVLKFLIFFYFYFKMSSRSRTRNRNPDQSPPAPAPRRRGRTTPAETTAIPIHPPDQPVPEPKEPAPEQVEDREEAADEQSESSPAREAVVEKKTVSPNPPEEQQQDDDDEPPIEMKTYSVRRIKSTFGISHFELNRNGEKLMIGTYKTAMFGDPSVLFSSTEKASSQQTATMNVSEKETMFKVTSGNQTLAVLNIIRPGGSDTFPRQWEGTLFEADGHEKHLYSKSPSLNREGKYVLNFGGRMTVNSVKNCILIDRGENFEVVGIRKIEKNTLEIDARSDFSELEVFILGSAAFLAK